VFLQFLQINVAKNAEHTRFLEPFARRASQSNQNSMFISIFDIALAKNMAKSDTESETTEAEIKGHEGTKGQNKRT